MTDKIIIDGVDVSKCQFLTLHLGDCLCAKDGIYAYCEWEQDCCYKQLKRKKLNSKPKKKRLRSWRKNANI